MDSLIWCLVNIKNLSFSFSKLYTGYKVFFWGIGPAVRVFANGPGDLGSIPGRVIPKTLKWYLIPPCLTLSIIRYGSRVKWSNPGNGVAPSPTPWCSSYRKGSLLVTLDYGLTSSRTYFFIFSFLQESLVIIKNPNKNETGNPIYLNVLVASAIHLYFLNILLAKVYWILIR